MKKRAECGECRIPEKIINLLHHRGLYVGKLFGKEHIWSGGAWIAKPRNTPGNIIENYEGEFPIETDATPLVLYGRDEKWYVLAQEHAPVMYGGDFENCWDTVEEAINDIFDFYFGDPARMMKKQEIYA